MASNQYQVVYVDDDRDDRDLYKRHLETDKRLIVETVIPREHIGPELIKEIIGRNFNRNY